MLPHTINPMLAQAAQEPFDSEQHAFEVKWNGVRALVFVEKKSLRIQSRQGLNITSQFPELSLLRLLPSGTVLDGELVIMRDKHECLSSLQKRVPLQNSHRIEWLSVAEPALFVAFDLLYFKGRCLFASPYGERRLELESLLERTPSAQVILAQSVRFRGQDLFAAACDMGLEGVVA
jgi:ATP-dependent DNA ligase